jgi:hypothetical protein
MKASILTPAAIRPETREQLADRLEAEGFVIGRPLHVSLDAIAIDRETAAESTCDSCGHFSLEFVPFRAANRNRQDRTYRALAWCCSCDSAFEM